MDYPKARRDMSVVDNYHGTVVHDPYRWLENPDADESKKFVNEQRTITESFLQTCETREILKEHFKTLYNLPREVCPSIRGDKCFYLSNTPLQAQSVPTQEDGNSTYSRREEFWVYPNILREDEAVISSVLSEDGYFAAYGISTNGSDWMTIKIIRTADNSCMNDDSVSWVKFSSITWTHDSKGFFYSRYPIPREGKPLDAGTETDINLDHQLFYHFLGTGQSEDILCWKDSEHPKWTVFSKITEDGKYVLLSIKEGGGTGNRLFYCDLSVLHLGLEGYKGSKEMLPFQKFIDNFEARYDLVANDGSVFTFRTNKNAPRYRLVRVDFRQPESWSDFVGESENDVLESACCGNVNRLILFYSTRDIRYHVIQIRDLQSGYLVHNLTKVPFGSYCPREGRRKDKEIYITFRSFLIPKTILRCNLDEDKPELKPYPRTAFPDFDHNEFEVNKAYTNSMDGTRIPMFIISKKGIHRDGSHPALLYGYGGFSKSLHRDFNAVHIVLSKHLGAVIAIANIRGGGEFGEEWHSQGSLDKKKNCFDDFISAANYLVTAGYTVPGKLCIEGNSNGGLLVAACINQRPDLFGCALAFVGVMDMLRFHQFTAGHAWTAEYGCSDKEEEFHWLFKYSPLHNVNRQNSQYPATMLGTADHDDRVVPHHSLKLLATMQYVLCTSEDNSPQTNPIIGRIDTKCGHGAGKSLPKRIDELADKYAFMAKAVGASWID